MKLLTKEEEAGHYRATLQGGILGSLGGVAVGVLGVVGAARRYPAFNQLTLPLKAFLITSAGTFSGIITADHASRSYGSGRNPADQAYASREEERKAAELTGMTWTQRAMAWGKEERYKIVGASWVASMVASFAIVGRNPYLTGTQKLVQARVYAQGLTLAVLLASAAFEIQDSRAQRGRYETKEYVDEKDHKEHTRQVEIEPQHHDSGDTLWKDMVEQEEERLRERDEAIKRMEESDRKKRAKEHREHPKKENKEQKPKEAKKDEKKEDGEEGGSEDEEEEEEEEYQRVPGKKGEGKYMKKVSDPPMPGTAVP